MQRILNVEYSFPAHVNVSPECRDLLSRLLVADPRSRITMDGIWRHPWFQQNLPEGVAEMNLHLLKNPETFSGLGQQVMQPLLKPCDFLTAVSNPLPLSAASSAKAAAIELALMGVKLIP